MQRTANRFLAPLGLAAASAVILPCLAVPCLAQTASQGTAATRPGSQRMHAVVVPDRGIDPGMRIRPPRMPPQSTPVIRPPTTTPDGSAVIVPK